MGRLRHDVVARSDRNILVYWNRFILPHTLLDRTSLCIQPKQEIEVEAEAITPSHQLDTDQRVGAGLIVHAVLYVRNYRLKI